MSTPVAARPPPRTPMRPHRPGDGHHSEHHHPKPLTWRETAALVVEGIAGGTLVLGVLLLIYLFGGHSATMFDRMFDPKARMSDGTEPAPPPKFTTLYTDAGNGKLLVREIDTNRSRIIGTISKEEAEIAKNMYRDPRRYGIDPNADATARLNAFSQTFK